MKIRSITLLTMLCGFVWSTGARADDPPSVVFVVGEGEYRSEWSMTAMADLLERDYGFETTVLIDQRLQGGPGNNIEGLEALETADLAVFYLRFRQLPPEQLAMIATYIERGGPIVGFRTSTHAFDFPEDHPSAAQWNAFGADVLGAPWKYHYGHDARTDVMIPESVSDHPVVSGVEPQFSVRSWTYHVRDDFPPADATVLAFGRPVRPDEGALGDETVNPIAWVRTGPGGGRTFTTTMGHPRDFGEPPFRKLLVNGMHWSLGLPSPEGPVGSFPRFKERTGEPWQDMDYGPFLSAAIEVDPENIASKGVAIPLNEDGSTAALFDTAELRWAAGWHGDFVELRGIVYDGPHGTWPRIAGDPAWVNPAGPGVTMVFDASGAGNFDDPRNVPFGPLPVDHGRFEGMVPGDEGIVLRYSVGDATVLERMGVDHRDGLTVWSREFQVADFKTSFDVSLFEIDDDVEAFAGDDARDRRYTTIQRDGEVVGAVGWVGSVSATNPRPSVEAAILDGENFQPGRMTARFVPPLVGSGGGRFRVLFATLDDAQLPAFLDRVATADRGGDLAAVWAEGSPRRWDDRIVLEGALAVSFGAENDDTSSFRVSAGRGVAEERFECPDGAISMLLDFNGQRIDAGTAPLNEAMVVFEARADTAPIAIAGWDFDEEPAASMRNRIGGASDLRLDGVTWRRGVRGRSLDFDGTARAVWMTENAIDPAHSPITISAWIHTTKDGTIVSRTGIDDDWEPDGVTFFVRDGHLAFDIGWVGVVEGSIPVADGQWHHVAVSLDPEEGEVVLWVDGEADGIGSLSPEGPSPGNSFQVGFTSDEFPSDPWFSGYIDGLRVHDRVLDAVALQAVAAESGEPLIQALTIDTDAVGTFQLDEGDVVVRIPERDRPIDGVIRDWRGPKSRLSEFIADRAEALPAVRSAFAIDRVSWPDENPWDSWMRFGDFDFLDDGSAAAISTWSGDVWRVDGLDADLDRLEWQRIASGLNQPLGLATRDDEILVVGRDQITRLVDLDGDRETDVYEAFNVDAMNSPHFHEPASGLQVGPDGSLYYLKAARHAKLPVHSQHGTLIRVDADGGASEIVAGGLRAPNGLAVDSDGVAWSSDQEGHWMPANRINRIEEGSFQGNNWSGVRLGLDPLPDYDRPLLWIHPSVDRSPAAQVRVPQGVWGDLEGKLLGISYGTGEVYLLLEDEVDGVHQGAFVPLPIKVPTGVMRGRFHPTDHSLYIAGLFGWSSDQTDPGGFYRIRRTDSPSPMPLAVRAVEDGLIIEFNQPVSTEDSDLAAAFALQAWNYRWSSDYGSPKLDLRTGEPGITMLPITGGTKSPDGRTIRLEVPGMSPAMQMHLDWRLRFEGLGEHDSFVHFTVHRLAPGLVSETDH